MTGRRICATIEARMTSSRLPGKVLMELAGKPALERMVERLQRVPSLDGIILATTVNDTDDDVVALAKRLGIDWYRGSEEDVLARVLGAARHHEADVIVETTGDCPLIDPQIVERVIQRYLAGGADYVSNFLQRSYPPGMEAQAFATDILADVAQRTDNADDREHVSLFIYNHPELYRLANVAAPPALDRPETWLTLDTAEDLELIRAIYDTLHPANPEFGLADILALLDERPDLAGINRMAHASHG